MLALADQAFANQDNMHDLLKRCTAYLQLLHAYPQVLSEMKYKRAVDGYVELLNVRRAAGCGGG